MGARAVAADVGGPLEEPLGPSRWVRCEGVGCSVVFPANRRTARYHSKRCADRTWKATTGAGRMSRQRAWEAKNAMRAAALGRVCRWCQARDDEVGWSGRPDECATCNRRCMPGRGGRCGRCNGPRMFTMRGRGAERHAVVGRWCLRCDRKPEGAMEVIWCDRRSDRERRVWLVRPGPGDPKDNGAAGWNGTSMPIPKRAWRELLREGQTVVFVEPAVWVQWR